MLVRAEEEARLVIGQASHAWLSGQLARAWGNAAFPAPDPREEVCLAAEQHDVGMSLWDLEPRLDADGRAPVPFTRMTVTEHLALWRAAPQRLMSASHHAALLVSLHGTALYARRDLDRMAPQDAAAVRAYLAEERERQAALIARLGVDLAQVERNRALLWAWDGLSLALCLGWPEHVAAAVPTAEGSADVVLRWQGRAGERRAALEPWPFAAEEVRVRCEGRRLDGRHADREALAAALAAARPFSLEFVLAPASAG